MDEYNIILGIDPGTTIMGFGLIKTTKSEMRLMQLHELQLKKYDNPDKVVLGRVINNLKEESKMLNENEKKTGCTVHFVNEKLDSGKIILKKFFYIEKKDNIYTLKKKTQKLEYSAFSEAIIKVIK